MCCLYRHHKLDYCYLNLSGSAYFIFSKWLSSLDDLFIVIYVSCNNRNNCGKEYGKQEAHYMDSFLVNKTMITMLQKMSVCTKKPQIYTRRLPSLETTTHGSSNGSSQGWLPLLLPLNHTS